MPSVAGALLLPPFRIACFISSWVMACSSGVICVAGGRGELRLICFAYSHHVSLGAVFSSEMICKDTYDFHRVPVAAAFVVEYLSYGSLCTPFFLFVRCGILLGVHHPFDRFLVCLISLFVAERCAFLLFSLLVNWVAVIFLREGCFELLCHIYIRSSGFLIAHK